jgi:hypothetical protein
MIERLRNLIKNENFSEELVKLNVTLKEGGNCFVFRLSKIFYVY